MNSSSAIACTALQSHLITHPVGTTIWSPLASGLLSGKYALDVVPEGSRLSHERNSWLLKQLREGNFNGLEAGSAVSIFEKIDKLKPIAEKLGTTMAVLSIAWCLKNKNVSTVITGMFNLPQYIACNLNDKSPCIFINIIRRFGYTYFRSYCNYNAVTKVVSYPSRIINDVISHLSLLHNRIH